MKGHQALSIMLLWVITFSTAASSDLSVNVDYLNPAGYAVTDNDLIGAFRVMTSSLITPDDFAWLKHCVTEENSLTHIAFHLAQREATHINLGFPLFSRTFRILPVPEIPPVNPDLTLEMLNPTGYTVCDNDIVAGWRVMSGHIIPQDIYKNFRTIAYQYHFTLANLAHFYLAHFAPQVHLQIPALSEIETYPIELPNSMRLYGYKGDRFIANAVSSGVYEPHMVALIRNVVKSGDWAVDVGANIGYFTALLAEQTGSDGKVLCIEALAPFVKLLTQAQLANAWQQVEILPYALSNKKETLVFYNNPVNPGGSLMLKHDEVEYFRVPRPDLISEVPAMPLDSLAHKIQRIDFMKIDVEGMEDLVFEGAQALIEEFKPVLAFEFTPSRYLQRGVDPVQFLERYQDFGYKFAFIHDVCHRPDLRCAVEEKRLLPAAIVARTVQHVDIVGVWYERT